MNATGNSSTLYISGFLADHLVVFILMLGLVELALAIIAGCKLYSLLRRIIAVNRPRNIRHSFPEKTGVGQIRATIQGDVSKDYHKDIDELRDRFENAQKWYTAFSMLIQIFPLMGILGTVAGLFRSIALEQEIYVGVQFALATTIYGLIFAILFKIVDTLYVALLINRIEEGFDRYEKDYRIENEASTYAEQE